MEDFTELYMERFGVYANVYLLTFIFKLEDNKWYALTEHQGNFYENELVFRNYTMYHDAVSKRKKRMTKIYLKNTPYGNLLYTDFKPLVNRTHREFIPENMMRFIAEYRNKETGE